MTWFHSGRGSRVATLIAGTAAALLAAASLAPVAGAQTSPAAGAWAVQASPNPKGALISGLGAVSCWGLGDCVAVGGFSYPSSQEVPNQHVLVEQLTGGRWTIVPTPEISGVKSSSLSEVSCPAASFCAAVGSVQLRAKRQPPGLLAETWNGTSWSATILPNPPGGSYPELDGVSCAAAGDCVAVGDYVGKGDSYRLLAEQLDGSTWSVLPTPVPPHGAAGNSDFTGVDCPTTSFCEVVGIVAYNDTLQSVFAYGLGRSIWTYQHQVNPGPDPGNSDYAVSCSGAGACTSVGVVAIIGESALAESWNGSAWVRQDTPAPAHRPATALYDVSCGSGSSCVAIGESYRVDQKDGHLIDPLVMGEVWNGTAWSQSPPALTSRGAAELSGISCPSPTACVAVGGAAKTSSETTLIEAYTG
jgi:hypothetical protein